MAELFDGTQVEEVSGVLALDGARNAQIYEHTMTGFVEVLGIGVEELFELKGVIGDYLFGGCVTVEVGLCSVFGESCSVLIK
jgi:hypothetical protein